MMKIVLPQGRNQVHSALNSALAKTFLLFCFLTFSVGFAQAQRMVSGVVNSDADGQPIPGVSVVVKGTTTGGVTDLDGKYAVKVPDDKAVLVFSGVGFTTQEVAVGSQATVDIKLVEDTKTLGEVVVIGYGTQKKKDLTGSVASLSEKDFQKGNVATPEQLVAGKLAGVSITSNGGAPGSGSRIRVRGASSLNASNDPLIVIDNVPLETLPGDGIKGAGNPLSLLNPNDIENITVLKDASATAIYGSRATNGVIIVTTKKGAKGQKVGFNFSSVLSSSQVAKTLDVLSGDEIRDIVNRLGNADQKKTLGTASTDWQSLIYGSAFSHDNNLSASGAIAGKLPFRASVGYLDQNGILLGSNMKRTTASLSLSPSFLDDHLRLNVNYKGAFVNNTFADQGTIGGAASFDPTQDVRGKDNKFGGYFEFVDASGKINTLAPKNPLAILENRQDKGNVNRHIANAQLDYKFHFLPELRANLNIALDRSNSEGTVLFDSLYGGARAGKGVNNFYTQNKDNKTLEAYLNYVKELGSSTLDFMVGHAYQDFYTEGVNDNRDQNRVFTTDSTLNILFPIDQNTVVSFFGRAKYDYKDKYLLTVSVRSDGSSRLAPKNRWVTYPAAALAWRISEEDFLKSTNLFADLKVRLGWGITGQQDGIGNYAFRSVYSTSGNSAQYQLGNQFVTTIRPEGYNPDLKWQTTTTYNAGLDMTVFSGRASVSVDYYRRNTDDLLNEVPVPAGSNFTNRIISNVGNMENSGIEVNLNLTPVKTQNLTWETNFNFTHNTNKITKLNLVDIPGYLGVSTGGIAGGVGNEIQIHSVDYPINSFFVHKQVYDESGKPLEGVYSDLNADGVININDRYRYFQPDAQILLGFTSNLSYKDFSFGFVLRGNVGNYVYNNVNSERGVFKSSSTNFVNNIVPNYNITGYTNNQYFSDFYMENASFLRADNISLGYNLSNLFKNKVRVQLSAIVQNAFVVTNYTGLDPEIAGGIDNNFYPRPRTFSLGLNVGF